MVKEKRGGQPGRTKVAGQRKWHGRSGCRAGARGRLAMAVGLLQYRTAAWSPAEGRVGARPRGREGGPHLLGVPSPRKPLATLLWTSSFVPAFSPA